MKVCAKAYIEIPDWQAQKTRHMAGFSVFVVAGA